NLMPCVLPVLSLKLLSVVAHGGQDPAHVRRGFIASAAGIVFSFLLIAGGLIAVRSAGVAIGWGIQFQQPIFLVAMTLILTLFACNLFGLFEIILPGRLGNIAGSAGDSNSLGGHFTTGAFATLLATPCSAPFLGTAVGFALSRGAAEILGIFFVLGIGLALPYLAVAAFPRLATQLPKPGNWMNWLRRILALALIGTAVWLVTVLAVQLGINGAVSIAAISALIVSVLALRRLPASRLGQHAVKVAFVLGLAALFVGEFSTPPSAPSSASAAEWEWFDETAIARYVASEKTVFVDVTADWCLTCQVNKKLVLDTAPVADWLDESNVIRMRADWTRPNPAISTYLARFGRYGIPFNVVYGPKAPQGIALPELLTDRIVMEAAYEAGVAPAQARK
ncbi:MAG: thioredoxin family protein, partial [Pseudomonadota bacterium]|nr:thioredoxin family protein [Pseudomonadota bacterium]